jgi:predicted Fe-Mo cluster-binding NifX family protein
MRVAIPNWQGRVSPVFDVAENILLADISGKQVNLRQDLALSSRDPFERARLLRALRTEILICCTLSRPHQMALASAGIRIIPHICGQVEEIINAISNGQLSDSFLMPGCRGRSRVDWLNSFCADGQCKKSKLAAQQEKGGNRDVQRIFPRRGGGRSVGTS